MGNIGGARVTKSVERLEHHDPRVRVDSRHAHAIAAIGGDDPGGNRAVAVMVPRLVVGSQNIPADDVVDIAVSALFASVPRRPRSDERTVGKGGGRTVRLPGLPSRIKKKTSHY